MGCSGLFKFAEPGRIELFLFVLLLPRLFSGSFFFFLLNFEKVRIPKTDRRICHVSLTYHIFLNACFVSF